MHGPDVEQLTLFQEDFRANLFPWQETRKGKRTNVIYGLRCYELSENLRRVGSSVRTYLESCTLPLPTLSRIWSVSAITSSCSLLRLRLSAQDTDASGYSLWRTPTSSQEDGRGTFSSLEKLMHAVNEKGHTLSLANQVKFKQLYPTPNTMDALPPKSQEALEREATEVRLGRNQPSNLRDVVNVMDGNAMWPTPTTQEAEHPELTLTETGRRETKDGSNSHSIGLADAVKLWPTSTVDDSANVNPKPNRIFGLVAAVNIYPTPTTGAGLCGGSGNYQQLKDLEEAGQITEEERRSMAAGNGGSLNPTWVELLMGFPKTWTEVD